MPAPARTLSPFDAVAIIVGIVLGTGIFKTPSLVAANSGSAADVILFWLLGGFISLAGALCYAELTTTYPDAGGDYHFSRQALGARPVFLFAWARMTVIQTGSIAMLAFVIGDYASSVLCVGARSSSWYAAAVIVALTVVNYALGRDFRLLSFLGSWKEGGNASVNGLLIQGCIALLLVVLGSFARSGFSTMVEYTASVFWLFFLLTGISLFVLRRKDPLKRRPFSVPLYPFTPFMFCLVSLHMLQSSFMYAGIGATAGTAVLFAGMTVMYVALKCQNTAGGGS